MDKLQAGFIKRRCDGKLGSRVWLMKMTQSQSKPWLMQSWKWITCLNPNAKGVVVSIRSIYSSECGPFIESMSLPSTLSERSHEALWCPRSHTKEVQHKVTSKNNLTRLIKYFWNCKQPEGCVAESRNPFLRHSTREGADNFWETMELACVVNGLVAHRSHESRNRE